MNGNIILISILSKCFVNCMKITKTKSIYETHILWRKFIFLRRKLVPHVFHLLDPAFSTPRIFHYTQCFRLHPVLFTPCVFYSPGPRDQGLAFSTWPYNPHHLGLKRVSRTNMHIRRFVRKKVPVAHIGYQHYFFLLKYLTRIFTQ